MCVFFKWTTLSLLLHLICKLHIVYIITEITRGIISSCQSSLWWPNSEVSLLTITSYTYSYTLTVVCTKTTTWSRNRFRQQDKLIAVQLYCDGWYIFEYIMPCSVLISWCLFHSVRPYLRTTISFNKNQGILYFDWINNVSSTDTPHEVTSAVISVGHVFGL